jgi:hypothetical protein
MSVSAEFIEFFRVSISIKQPNSLLVVIYINVTNHCLARKSLPRPGVSVEVDEVRSDGKKLQAREIKPTSASFRFKRWRRACSEASRERFYSATCLVFLRGDLTTRV